MRRFRASVPDLPGEDPVGPVVRAAPETGWRGVLSTFLAIHVNPRRKRKYVRLIAEAMTGPATWCCEIDESTSFQGTKFDSRIKADDVILPVLLEADDALEGAAVGGDGLVSIECPSDAETLAAANAATYAVVVEVPMPPPP